MGQKRNVVKSVGTFGDMLRVRLEAAYYIVRIGSLRDLLSILSPLNRRPNR